MPIILLVGLVWGAYLSLMLRKATQDDAVLTAISFSAYLAIFLLALFKRKQARSLIIHAVTLLLLCLTGSAFIFAFVSATDGVERAAYSTAVGAFTFLGEMLCLFQWICVATSVFVDWLMPPRKN